MPFRYFNAAGASPDGEMGENHDPETHLIPLVIDAALGKREKISVFGTDYPTGDGTYIRDYIHAEDLGSTHVLGLQFLEKNNISERFNLVNGLGFSVREVLDSVKKISVKDFQIEYTNRRPGDPPTLIGSADKACKILGWNPKYADLDQIVSHAVVWHLR